MKEISKITGILTGVCIICAFLLSFIYAGAKEKIAYNEKKAIEDAIARVVPRTAAFEELVIEDEKVFKLFDDSENIIGYGFLAEGQGYQGKITILAVIDPRCRELAGIEVIESIETPGLGAKIQGTSFKKQFVACNVSGDIEYVKRKPSADNQIQAITGATVSSKAVVSILNKRIRRLKEDLMR